MRPVLALVLALAPVPALAQQPGAQAPASTCDVQIDTSRHSQFTLEGGYYNTFAWAGVWGHCRGQPTTMYSDSVAWYPGRDLLFLVGNVRFRDSITILNADRVTYYLHQERLYAEGHVYTRNLRSGSDLRGNNLDYYRAVPPQRDTLELFAQQRPTIRFFPSNRPARSDTEPFIVVADRTHMKGNDEMWGGGHVTIDRSDLAARGDSAWLDLGHNAAALLGSPQVNGVGPDAYHLRGDRLTFTLTPEHEIKRVLSSGDAAANGADWRVTADTLDLALDSGKVQRAQAWGHGRRPDAVSGAHTIVADSLDVHMPQQVVQLVWAWGRARVVTRDTSYHPAAARDSASGRRTEVRDSIALARGGRAPAARDSAGAASRPDTSRSGAAKDSTGRKPTARDTAAARPLVGDDDWLMGDSLRADFERRQDSASAKPKSDLKHLTSYGSARALYHTETSDTARLERCRDLNYARGQRIDIAMDSSKVRTVDVVGEVDGMYLECNPPAPDTTRKADTTGAADTARAAGGAAGRPAADTLRAGAPPAAPAQNPAAPPADTTHPSAPPPARPKP